MMRAQQNARSRSPIEDLFEQFPRGVALLELNDLADLSTWRLAHINDFASSVVVPSVETFLYGDRLGVGHLTDLPELYREILRTRHTRVIGIVEARSSTLTASQHRLYMLSAFPAGESCVGILFEDAQSSVEGRNARALAERRLAQTCEFVGAILWRAEPATLQFTYVSPQAQGILGYWQERWTGETNFWKKHIVPEDTERVVAACEKIVRERRRHDFEFRMFTVHGQVLWFHAAAEPAKKVNGGFELVGVLNDITDLKRAEERIRALTSRLMRVQDDERRHISRELHDSLGQYLTSVKINLELVKRESPHIDEAHRALLAESSDTLERCVQEVRSVSYLLHPPLLDELGLLAALRWYTAGFAERSSIEVNLKTPNRFSRLPGEMELALFRIVQESLTNVQRHSRSDAAWVTLTESADRAEISVTDCGVGIPPETIERITQGKTTEGIGLRGMYERLRELGGQLTIESTPSGTSVSAVLPLQSMKQQPRNADEEAEERRSRAAGKPLQSTDLHIEHIPTGENGAGDAREEDVREFPSTRRKRRRASRRST